MSVFFLSFSPGDACSIYLLGTGLARTVCAKIILPFAGHCCMISFFLNNWARDWRILKTNKNFTTKLPRTTLGTGLARTGTNTGTPTRNHDSHSDSLLFGTGALALTKKERNSTCSKLSQHQARDWRAKKKFTKELSHTTQLTGTERTGAHQH